jgi:hypothetical protein
VDEVIKTPTESRIIPVHSLREFRVMATGNIRMTPLNGGRKGLDSFQKQQLSLPEAILSLEQS